MKIINIILYVLDNFKVVILILIRECRQDLTKKKREKLFVEIEEEQERQIAKKEEILISKAKKAKKDAKQKSDNPYDTKMGELLNQEKEEERYLGKEKIKILTNRFVKRKRKSRKGERKLIKRNNQIKKCNFRINY